MPRGFGCRFRFVFGLGLVFGVYLGCRALPLGIQGTQKQKVKGGWGWQVASRIPKVNAHRYGKVT